MNDYKINLVEVAFLDDKLANFHSDFRIDDLKRAVHDAEYQKQPMAQYGIEVP